MKKRNPGAKHTFIDLTLIKVYTWAIIITHQIIHPSMVSLGPIADLYSALSKSMTTTPWHDTKIRWDERAQTLTSSTQQQVWSGLGTGSGFSGLQLKLSPEPRVEQGHAQEVKPAPQRKWEREREEERKRIILTLAWFIMSRRGERQTCFRIYSLTRSRVFTEQHTRASQTPHTGVRHRCDWARAGDTPASLASIAHWHYASKAARASRKLTLTKYKSQSAVLSSPKFGDRG